MKFLDIRCIAWIRRGHGAFENGLLLLSYECVARLRLGPAVLSGTTIMVWYRYAYINIHCYSSIYQVTSFVTACASVCLLLVEQVQSELRNSKEEKLFQGFIWHVSVLESWSLKTLTSQTIVIISAISSPYLIWLKWMMIMVVSF